MTHITFFLHLISIIIYAGTSWECWLHEIHFDLALTLNDEIHDLGCISGVARGMTFVDACITSLNVVDSKRAIFEEHQVLIQTGQLKVISATEKNEFENIKKMNS